MWMLHEQIDCYSTKFRLFFTISITFHKFHFVMIMGFIEEILTITLKMLISLMRLLVWMPSALFGSTTLFFQCCLTACCSRLFASKHTNFPFCPYCFRTQYKNQTNESEWMVKRKTQANEIKENAIYWLIFNHRYWLIELFIFRHLFLSRSQLSTACQFNRSISSWR